MPPTSKPRCLTICAALTADGKLDEVGTLPAEFFESLTLGAEDVVLTDGRATGERLAERVTPAQLLSVDGHDEMAGVLNELRARRVFCFGGPRWFRALLDGRQVDELRLVVRPRIDGRRGAPGLSGGPGDFFWASVRCRLLRMEVPGGECLLHYRVLRAKTPRPAAAENEASGTR